MSSMRPDATRYSDKPPAAIAGSPGTAIFHPQLSRTPTTRRRPPSPTKLDQVPVQWSLESGYSLFGMGAVATHRTTREDSGVASWFSRKRDKNRAKSIDTTHHSDPEHTPTAPVPAPQTPPRLPPIPASYTPPRPSTPVSNLPSPPRLSRPPSPVAAQSQPNFRPTSTTRPGSSAGFKPHSRPPVTRSRGIGSVPPPFNTNTTTTLPTRRRPATASGTFPAAARSSSSLSDKPVMHNTSSSLTIPRSNGSTLSLSRIPSSNPRPPRTPPPPRKIPQMFPPPTPRILTCAAVRKAARMRGFVLKNGKRHHPRPHEEAPYPRDYERRVLDHDVWEHGFARELAGSTTFHAFTAPPGRVLDLGCGTGTWIIDCARDWPDTHFIGLDLVPIQPDPVHLGLDSRVHWVHANFLERLPFADGAFDFVHVRRIARGVPEDRWEGLFEEIARVLRIGGALEIIEEDLFFPGSAWMDEDCESGIDVLAPAAKHVKEVPVVKDASRSMEALHKPRVSKESQSPEEATPRHSTDVEGRSFLPDVRGSSEQGRSVQGDASSSSESLDNAPLSHLPLADPRDHTLLERAYTEMHAARFINLTPLSVLHSALVQYFRDVRSHGALQISFPLTETPHSSLPPLVTLDNSRVGTINNLPNRNWHFDVHTLNMHLSARVTEVLACAEEMWAHVESTNRGPLASVAREEWEECLTRFEMDMQDKIRLDQQLNERLGWRVRPMPRTPERKAFDEAVRRWEHHKRRSADAPSEPRGHPLSRRIRAFVAWKGLGPGT